MSKIKLPHIEYSIHGMMCIPLQVKLKNNDIYCKFSIVSIEHIVVAVY